MRTTPLKLSGTMRVVALDPMTGRSLTADDFVPFSQPPSIPWNRHLRELAHGFMCTAIEGGIGYWCQLDSYDWYDVGPDGTRYEDGSRDHSDLKYRCRPVIAHQLNGDESGYVKKGVPVSAVDMLRAMQKLAQRKVKGFSPAGAAHWARKAGGWLLAPEDADYDSGDADVVFQVATLGEVVYG